MARKIHALVGDGGCYQHRSGRTSTLPVHLHPPLYHTPPPPARWRRPPRSPFPATRPAPLTPASPLRRSAVVVIIPTPLPAFVREVGANDLKKRNPLKYCDRLFHTAPPPSAPAPAPLLPTDAVTPRPKPKPFLSLPYPHRPPFRRTGFSGPPAASAPPSGSFGVSFSPVGQPSGTP